MRVSGINYRISGLRTVIFALFFLAAAALPVFSTGPFAAGSLFAGEQLFDDELTTEELKKGHFFYMIDEQGRTVLTTGRRLRVKDRFLNAANELYEVVSVDGYLARARFVEKVKLTQPAVRAIGVGEI